MLGSSCPPPRTYLLRALSVALAAAPFLAAPAYAVNYVPNPGFESCVQDAQPTSWAPVGGDEVNCDGLQANNGMFSLALSNPSVNFARAQSDCIVVPSGTLMQTFRFAYRTAGADVVQVGLTAQTYTGADCTGSSGIASAGVGVSFVTPIVTDGNWQTLPNVTALVDAAHNSVRFTASFQVSTAAANSVVHFDDLEYADASSGTTSTTLPGATSTTIPGATTSTTISGGSTTTTLPSFPGTGAAASECYVTFAGIATGRVDCTDGDPACDVDGAANGTCSFALGVCVAQALTGCQAPTITSLRATPASLAIPLPAVPASVPACGAPAPIVVPLRKNGRRPGRASVAFVAKSDGKPKRERDVLRFRCLPPA